ncbi:MAG: glycosyltransferase, partial [Candidatus Altiarchaeales archaeon]|nr:glycosyltransferase [Candidatus Altiarchaeales archaeon]
MSKLRVCILTTSFPRYEGDLSGQFVYALSRNLVERGVDVSVVAPHDYETRGYEVMGGVEVYRFRYMFPRRLQKIAYHGGISSNI